MKGIGRNESLVGGVGRKSLTLGLGREWVALVLLVEIAARHVQRARRLGPIPVVLLQLREQIGALGGLLDLLEGGPPHPGRPRETPAASRLPRPDGRQPFHVLGRDHRARGENQQPFDRVAELADVARPVVGREALHGLLLELLAREPTLLGELGHEVLDELRDVGATRPQRRDFDRHDIQPEVQVLAEPPRRDLGGGGLLCVGGHPPPPPPRPPPPPPRGTPLPPRAPPPPPPPPA